MARALPQGIAGAQPATIYMCTIGLACHRLAHHWIPVDERRCLFHCQRQAALPLLASAVVDLCLRCLVKNPLLQNGMMPQLTHQCPQFPSLRGLQYLDLPPALAIVLQVAL